MGSACYIYAIVARDTRLPDRLDAGAAELVLVPWRRLAAVTRRLPDAAPPATVAEVLHHEAVVEAVRRLGPALPVRFGTVFPDATSLESALADRYESLATDLDRVGDKVELSLTALWADAGPDDAPDNAPDNAPDPRAGRGARYIRARAAAFRREDAVRERARAVSRELDRALGGLALERQVSLLPTPPVAVRTAYLLDPRAVTAFRAAFGSIRGERGEVRVLLTGPWPPYSFVTRTEAPEARPAALLQLVTEALQARSG